MPASSLHILPFSLSNPYALTWDPDGPFRVLIRLLTTPNFAISEIDLSPFAGKTVLITGATGGCGFECARALARVGCRLVLTARDGRKAEILKEGICGDAQVDKETSVDVLELDMGSYESICRFGEVLSGKYGFLDAAVLNAGVYCAEFGRCETEMEETVQVNFLSTAAVSLITLPLLLKANSPSPSRLLFISSEAHGWSDPHQNTLPDLLSALNDPTSYKPWMRYHISKLLLVLWTKELAIRLDSNRVVVASASSGFTRTGMFRDFSEKYVAALIERAICRTAEHGAAQNLMALVRMGMDENGTGNGGNGHGGFWSDGRFRRPTTAASTDVAKGLRESMWDGLMDVLPEEITRIAREDSGLFAACTK